MTTQRGRAQELGAPALLFGSGAACHHEQTHQGDQDQRGRAHLERHLPAHRVQALNRAVEHDHAVVAR